MTTEEIIAFVDGSEERIKGYMRRWSQDPEFRAALRRKGPVVTHPFPELSCVVATNVLLGTMDSKEIPVGTQGTIVGHIMDGRGYIVEFFGDDGQTLDLADALPGQIALRDDPETFHAIKERAR